MTVEAGVGVPGGYSKSVIAEKSSTDGNVPDSLAYIDSKLFRQ